MKKKPDISDFAPSAKDPSGFIEGAFADRTEKAQMLLPPHPPSPAAATAPGENAEVLKPEPTVQKLFRLRWDTANALRLGAATQSTTRGKRVTETEIVETLIRSHFKLDS